MQLPLSSSLPSITDSEDGVLTSHLMLANANAEFNRMAYEDFDEYPDNSPVTPQACQRLINFNPEVNVRFIRPRSGTVLSNVSDNSGTYRYIDSPLRPDCKQSLKESSPLSDDDEEFDRFYKTMEYRHSLGGVMRSSRRLSMDETCSTFRSSHRLVTHFPYLGNRQRSLSCDNYFFQVETASDTTTISSLSTMIAMICCLLKKKEPRRTVFPAPLSIDQVDVSVQCGRCRSPQAIPARAVVFVCSACHCVNRVRYSEVTQERRMSFIDCDIGEIKMLPNTPSLFQLGDATSGKPSTAIPICSVCLDGVGDMVLDTCNHGGICEECSRHIALNKAVGGSHCPKCRTEIIHILRIGELHEDFAKVREVDLPKIPNSTPPLVPPPVGYRKEKSNDPSTPYPTTESKSPDES